MSGSGEPPELPSTTRCAVGQLFRQYAAFDHQRNRLEASTLAEAKEAALSASDDVDTMLGPAALIHFFDDLDVDLLCLAALAFAWLGRWQHPCYCTRAEFERAVRYALWGRLQPHSNNEIELSFIWPAEPSVLVERLRAGFPDAVLSSALTSSEAFLDFYLFAFDYNQTSPYRRCLSLADARWLWRQLLGEPGCVGAFRSESSTGSSKTECSLTRSWRYLERFDAYLDTLSADDTTITRDTWYWVLVFAQRTQHDHSDLLEVYDRDGAWPLLLDGFVRFLLEQQHADASLGT
ncbi:hypothetical protein F1559_003407 [Cyanidiococcus yangmingshanensis]|uniref:Defective in cullin neddylation protein n=1 Tax=Cyanidiococcus yangmingshanensis TaxID=2690220 RepID=A0A7J7IKE8_9RHOD|nr:hypothetical protein F1559_003407 [Cyanidiococcus yangmingshanensis]